MSKNKNKKKRQTNARDFLQRSSQHVIDTKARNHFTSSIPPEWAPNPLSEGDYGKDYHIDAADGAGKIGKSFYVQLKGTEHCKYVDGGAAVSFPLEKKHLSYYIKEVTLPLFLVVVDVVQQKGYWLFVQRYLKETPGWDAAGSFSLRIPTANRLEDTASLNAAVAAAHEWMRQYQQEPLLDRLKKLVLEKESKDDRFKVQAVVDKEVARLQLVPVKPVNLTVTLRPKNEKLVAKMRQDLIDKGQPVAFDVGELTVEGSPLLSDVIHSSGTLQIATSADCVATLKLCDERENPVDVWSGIPAELTGGAKERWISSRLARSPLSFVVGPFGDGQKGTVKLSVQPLACWEGQSIRKVSYFDRIDALFTKIMKSQSLQVWSEIEGNHLLSVTVRTERFKTMSTLVEFLRLIRNAREVAKKLDIDPLFTAATMTGDALRDIDIAHSLLTTGRYELNSELTGETLVSREAAMRLLEERKATDMNLYAEDGIRFDFMGQKIDLGHVVWELSEVVLTTPDSEVRRLLTQPGNAVRLSIRTTPDARRVLRTVPEEEWVAAGHRSLHQFQLPLNPFHALLP